MLEMDDAMMTNVWNYNQPLYQRHCYERQPHVNHYYPRRRQTPDAVTSVFKSSLQPCCNLSYTSQPLSVATGSVSGSWKVVGGATGDDRQWPSAVTGHVLGRATDAVGAMAAASHHWSPYPGIGA